MDRSFLHTSRLTVIFIIAVALSGSTLTFFSINNISNQKELTEKKIIEEQRNLSGRISAALQTEISNITQHLISGSGIHLRDSLHRRATGHDFILQQFILDDYGNFIYPNFAGIPEILPVSVSSGRFGMAFRAGEEAEFAGRDPVKARGYYLECFGLAGNASDVARALNALGRIAVNLNHTKEAIARYSLVISDFIHLADVNGVPYVYYALPQLMKITPAVSAAELLPLMTFCLEKMENGSVPLNFNTEDLLLQVKGWSEANITDREKQSYMDSLINNLSSQINFISIYGNELQELVKMGNWNERSGGINDFTVFDPVSGDSKDFFLIGSDPGYKAGFLISSEKLFESILKNDLQSGLDFEYMLEFPGPDHPSESGNNLNFTLQLTPLFPGRTVSIKLKDEKLIKKIVQRRSWIYGISSVLLLVAMLLGVVLILRDVAREKHLARLRSDFISNVTHELKTPLTSIRMYAESLLMGRVKSSSSQKEYLSIVVNESERLKRMVNNILEFSKMEKGRQEYHPVESDLSEILLSAINDLKYWLKEKGFTLETDIEQHVTVKVDPVKFRQVFTNLLSNAIKFSGESRKIMIRLFKKEGHVTAEFEDEGIGIAKDEQIRIFEPFYRVDQQGTGEIAGTGLGLTVVKEIVEAHGGRMLVESEVGKGSIFTVRMPLS